MFESLQISHKGMMKLSNSVVPVSARFVIQLKAEFLVTQFEDFRDSIILF